MKNLCDTCCYSFASCVSSPVFASDNDATITGKDANVVVECDNFGEVDE